MEKYLSTCKRVLLNPELSVWELIKISVLLLIFADHVILSQSHS